MNPLCIMCPGNHWVQLPSGRNCLDCRMGLETLLGYGHNYLTRQRRQAMLPILHLSSDRPHKPLGSCASGYRLGGPCRPLSCRRDLFRLRVPMNQCGACSRAYSSFFRFGHWKYRCPPSLHPKQPPMLVGRPLLPPPSRLLGRFCHPF